MSKKLHPYLRPEHRGLLMQEGMRYIDIIQKEIRAKAKESVGNIEAFHAETRKEFQREVKKYKKENR